MRLPVGAAETCNGLDDDCDGVIDNGFDGLNDQCAVGDGQCRRVGFQRCNAAGNGLECSVQAAQPQDETCNGADDDCDGKVDETYADLGTACSDGEGICLNRGIRVCGADGQSVVCNAQAGQPADAEICNGLDDDCDGEIDNGFDGLNEGCSAGQGICRRVGVRV